MIRDHSHPSRVLLVAAVVLTLALLWNAAPAHARPVPYQGAEASYYGPGLYGNRTACGRTLTTSSWWVASLKRDTARCGLRVRICHPSRRRCVNVRVEDRGAWRGDRRRWDLTVRVRDALRCPDRCRVVWRRGW